MLRQTIPARRRATGAPPPSRALLNIEQREPDGPPSGRREADAFAKTRSSKESKAEEGDKNA
jgi:hypothetical protein